MTPKEYVSGNLLGVEVTALDVAQDLPPSGPDRQVNAAEITIDGGDGNDPAIVCCRRLERPKCLTSFPPR